MSSRAASLVVTGLFTPVAGMPIAQGPPNPIAARIQAAKLEERG